MPSRRLLRVQELLKRQIGESIRREIPIDRSGVITVNEVHISRDLRNATIFITILGAPEQQRASFDRLQHSRHRIQSQVAQAVILKFTPQIRFVLDESVKRGDRVLEILDDLEDSSTAS
jgi:ribosome-binding factor A